MTISVSFVSGIFWLALYLIAAIGHFGWPPIPRWNIVLGILALVAGILLIIGR